MRNESSSCMAKVDGRSRSKLNIRADFKIDVSWTPEEFKSELSNVFNAEDLRIVCNELEAKASAARTDEKKHSQSVEELTIALEKNKDLGEPVRVALENALRERKDKLEATKSLKERLVQFGGLVAMRGGEMKGIREKEREKRAEESHTYCSSAVAGVTPPPVAAPTPQPPKEVLAEKVKKGLASFPRSDLVSMCGKLDIPTGGDTDDMLRDKLQLYQATEHYEIDTKLTVGEFEAFMSSISSPEVARILRRAVEWPKDRAVVDKEKAALQLLELRVALRTTVSTEVRSLLQTAIQERELKLKHLEELVTKLGKFIVVLDKRGVK